MTGDERISERLLWVHAGPPVRQPRLENSPIRLRIAIGHRAALKFVPDENSAAPVPRDATKVETLPLPSNWLRRDTPPIPVSPRANTEFQLRRCNAHKRLADKS